LDINPGTIGTFVTLPEYWWLLQRLTV